MNETIHWEQHEPFRISILGQVISHETILWLCPLRKICWEMSDIKQHWCSLLENFSYLLCFAGLARVQIKKKFVQVKNNSLFRSSEAAVAAVLLTLFTRSDILILLLWLIWHLMSQSFEFSMLTPVHQWMHKFPGNSLSMSEFHFIVKLFWVLWLWLKFLPKTCVNFYAGKVEPYWKENERTQLIFVRFFYGRFFLAIFGIWGLEFKDNMRNNNLSGVPK